MPIPPVSSTTKATTTPMVPYSRTKFPLEDKISYSVSTAET